MSCKPDNSASAQPNPYSNPNLDVYPKISTNRQERPRGRLSNPGSDTPPVGSTTSSGPNADQFLPTAPILSDLEDDLELDNNEGPMFPPNKCDLPPTYSSLNLQEVKKMMELTEAEARQKFKEYVNGKSLWDNEPLNNIEILSIKSGKAYHYKLETFSEFRTCEERSRPYDGIYVGPDPAKVIDAAACWAVQVKEPEPFKPDMKYVELQGSCRVAFCDKCFGDKQIRCWWCLGKGWTRCTCCKLAIRERGFDPQGPAFSQRFGARNSSLSLDITENFERLAEQVSYRSDGSFSRSSSTLIRQRRTVGIGPESRKAPCHLCSMSRHGQGCLECTFCSALGKIQCGSCRGFGRIQKYTEVCVTWKVTTGDGICGMGCEDILSAMELKKAKGTLVNEGSKPARVDPLSPTEDDALHKLSQDLIKGQVARCEVDSEALKHQRFALKEIPVTVVRYACGNFYGGFAIFGNDGKVHAKDYPRVYACACSMVVQSWSCSFNRFLKGIQQKILGAR